jgi:hypothetical protein
MEQKYVAAAEQTYRAIGRFMFEFSQIEYMVRYYLAETIQLKEEYFSAVVESYDVGTLIAVAKQVFKKAREKENGADIERLLSQYHKLNDDRKRVAHGLWVPFLEGGTVHYVSRTKLSSSRFTDQAKELEKHADILCQLRANLEKEFLLMPKLIRRRR